MDMTTAINILTDMRQRFGDVDPRQFGVTFPSELSDSEVTWAVEMVKRGLRGSDHFARVRLGKIVREMYDRRPEGQTQREFAKSIGTSQPILSQMLRLPTA